MKHIKTIILTIASLIVSVLVPIATVGSSYALIDGAKDQAICGANLQDTNGSAGCTDTTDSENKVNNTLKTVISVLSIVVGVIAVIMIIIGGMRYVTSNGDGSSTSSARNTIIYAVVGLIVVALSQIIVRFVIGRV